MSQDDNTAAASAVQPEAHEKSTAKSGAENLDKVRDILFGSQAREYEKRFSRLEERLIKEASDLREDLKKRFDTLEGYIKREIESLAGRLKAEHDERTESAKAISGEIKDTSQAFERKTNQIGEHLNAGHRELREQLLDQSKNISEEIRQKHEAMGAALERATGELRNDKTDRAALASLFMEVAMRLNNEFKIPGSEDLE